jgi:hypothetical protein
MQVIASPRPAGRSVPVISVASGLIIGTFLLVMAGLVAYVTLATPLLAKLAGGPLTTSRVLVGVLAWTVALTAPVGFGLIGLLRIVAAVERIVNRVRPTPTVRVARSLGDDLYVAAGVMLPDDRPVAELVIGPFGAAVINEMPPVKSTRRNRSSWEQRMADGQWHPIDNPLDRAVRDAERVRRWFGADDRDFVVKVHAAVVDAGQSVERTSSCAVITPAQIPAWLASLPVQRGMSADRREGLATKIRATF